MSTETSSRETCVRSSLMSSCVEAKSAAGTAARKETYENRALLVLGEALATDLTRDVS